MSSEYVVLVRYSTPQPDRLYDRRRYPTLEAAQAEAVYLNEQGELPGQAIVRIATDQDVGETRLVQVEEIKGVQPLLAGQGASVAPAAPSGQLPRRPHFPTMLRKMWTGTEVQDWLEINVYPLLSRLEEAAGIAEHNAQVVGEKELQLANAAQRIDALTKRLATTALPSEASQ